MRAGEAVEVSWEIAANHGGGYVYRLCPATENLTEACFEKTVLPFASANSTLRWRNGKEASFEYRFELDPLLAGHDFQLAFTAFYADDADNYATTFYNGTLTILDPIGVFDTQTMFMYAIFAGVFAFAVYFGLQATGTLPAVKKALGMGKKKRVKKTETGTRGATDDDWLKGTSWTTHKGGKSE